MAAGMGELLDGLSSLSPFNFPFLTSSEMLEYRRRC